MIHNALDKRFPFKNNGSTGDLTPIWTPTIYTILICMQKHVLFWKVVLNTIEKKTTKTIPNKIVQNITSWIQEKTVLGKQYKTSQAEY
jgi:hypothetical protein